MLYSIAIVLKGLPKTQNALNTMHWAKKSAHNKKWKRDVLVAVLRYGKPAKPLSKATLKLTRCSSQQPDFDGLTGSFKCLIDGLVEAKVLSDDCPLVIGSPTYTWEKRSPKDGHVIIEVTGV